MIRIKPRVSGRRTWTAFGNHAGSHLRWVMGRPPLSAQADAAAGFRPKVTILEVADLSESTDPSVKLEPSSPRSVEACLHLGIDPADLRRIPLEMFLARERVHDLAQLLFTAAEKLRQVQFFA